MRLPNLLDLKREHSQALKAADAILDSATLAGREMTPTESAKFDEHLAEANTLAVRIRNIEAKTTLRMDPDGTFGLDGARRGGAPRAAAQKPMSGEYVEGFLALVRSGGKQATDVLMEGFDSLFGGYALPALPGMSGALYGGSNSAGGYAVPTLTDDQITPLAMPDLGVRSLARVIPTVNDIKLPTQATFGTAGIKPESGASTNTFTESDPTLSQVTLSAFMTGLTHTVSWELLQDVGRFQEFGIRDLLNAIDIAEDAYFVSGTGTGQPQGLLGNVGTGTGSPYAVESTGAYLLQSTMEVMATLKASYFPGAAWLMSRSTATAIRKAQLQANLFAPAWTRENGRDYLWGYPVSYSQTMPSLPTATTAGVTPILFGSFQDGYVIGDRGGSGTFIKVLDQPLATAGQTILLGYKRVDGRVRRSEAIQQISISHS